MLVWKLNYCIQNTGWSCNCCGGCGGGGGSGCCQSRIYGGGDSQSGFPVEKLQSPSKSKEGLNPESDVSSSLKWGWCELLYLDIAAGKKSNIVQSIRHDSHPALSVSRDLNGEFICWPIIDMISRIFKKKFCEGVWAASINNESLICDEIRGYVIVCWASIVGVAAIWKKHWKGGTHC